MALGRTFVSSVRCAACRFAILEAFASFSTPPVRPFLCRSSTRLCGIPPKDIRRCFSIAPRSRFEGVSWEPSLTAPNNSTQASESESNNDRTDSSEPLPWYLQVQTPRQEPKSLSDRQRLPDLPPNPPPLLQPMLHHISSDLGLDDLSLLDLREIDPPPALGANLMMIIGTARSEKHLHVSADRFCRWLRTTHKLAPYADGLLGRGELRLKLKRKNRRARMLNSVGASDRSNTDDGIRTGWVCVNIGQIEDGRVAEHDDMELEDGDYVGFGSANSGVKMVVQMLTEEKREELDLETFWGQALGRYTRRRDRIAMAGQQTPSPSETLSTSVGSNNTASNPIPAP